MTSDRRQIEGIIQDIKRRVRLVDVISMLGDVPLKKHGRFMKGCCPFHAEKTPSFTVRPDRDTYRCYGCGAAGDVIEYVMRRCDLDFRQAVEAIAGRFGIHTYSQASQALTPVAAAPSPVDDGEGDARRIKRAQAIIRQSSPAAGTLVEMYLRARGLTPHLFAPEVMRQLRFARVDYYVQDANGLPSTLGKFPAMVAPMQDSQGQITAAHVTYLDDSGIRKRHITAGGSVCPAKKMYGAAWGSCIRLGLAGPVMAVAEGIENGLTFMQARPDVPVWVAGSLTNMCGHGVGQGKPHPTPKRLGQLLPSDVPDMDMPGMVLPDICKQVWLIADSDSKDPAAFNAQFLRACRRFAKAAKVNIVRPPAGKDLNDLVKEGIA